jgi:hypothetical protein
LSSSGRYAGVASAAPPSSSLLLDAAAGGREEEELEMFNAKQITRTMVLAGTLAALAPSVAPAQSSDIATPTNKHTQAVHHNHHTSATPGSITFTNPLGRSRGPGAGAGLL